jgi:hypothetical protein
MGGQLQVDPATLRQGGQGVLDVAERVAGAWRDFVTKARGMGDIFGDDPVGGLIGASYGAAQQVADDSLNSVVNGLSNAGRGLLRMADSYDQTEQTNLGHFQRLANRF